MSTSNFAAVAVVAGIVGLSLHFSMIPSAPAHTSDPFSAVPDTFGMHASAQAAMTKNAKPVKEAKRVSKGVDAKALSEGGRAVFDSCKSRLSRRGMATGQKSVAAKFCVCTAENVAERLPYSKPKFKFASALIDVMLDRRRKDTNATEDLKKRARQAIRKVDNSARKDIYKTMTHALASCRSKSRLGFPPRRVITALIR